MKELVRSRAHMRQMAKGSTTALAVDLGETTYVLSPGERALLVALYDKMGSGRVTPGTFMDSRFEQIEEAYDGLLELHLVEGTSTGRDGEVDIALTDNGMEVANIVQAGYPRTAGLLEGQPRLEPPDVKAERLISELVHFEIPKIEFMGPDPELLDKKKTELWINSAIDALRPFDAVRSVIDITHRPDVYGAGLIASDPFKKFNSMPRGIIEAHKFKEQITCEQDDELVITLNAQPEMRQVRRHRSAWARCRQAIMAARRALMRWCTPSR